MVFLRRSIGFVLAGLLLILAACQSNPTDSIPETGEDLPPAISVEDQVFDGVQVRVAEVYSPAPAWLVIRAERDRNFGPIVGFTLLEPGTSQDLSIEIDPVNATDRLYALLYTDLGRIGAFDMDGSDQPMQVDGEVLAERFSIASLSEEDLELGELTNQVSIEIGDQQFDPLRVTITSPGTVTWVNQGDQAHTVTAENHSFNSGLLEPGQAYEFNFTRPGRYPYYCEIHGGPGGRGMAGVIIVR